MRYTKLLLLYICGVLFVAVPAQAGEWRGIVPLHSTRTDVERLIGKPNFKYGLYDFEEERVDIMYSKDPCTEGMQGSWNVAPDTVINIRVAPKKRLMLSDLQLDISKYEKFKDPNIEVHTLYRNEEEGITIDTVEDGEDHGKVLVIYYEPAAKDAHLRCPNSNQPVAKPDCSRKRRAKNNSSPGDSYSAIQFSASAALYSCVQAKYSPL